MLVKELAAASGLSAAAIIHIEKNHKKPSLPNLRLLSKIFGKPVSYLGCFENLPEETLGQKIKKARLYRGYTKVEFAKLIGVDVKTLRCWENDIHRPLQEFMKVILHFIIK